MPQEPVTVLDLIRAHFGDEVGPDLITKLAGKLPPEFSRFREEYHAWYRNNPRVPGRPSSHLRPFITGSYRGSRIPLYDLIFGGDEATIYRAIDAIKHQLLYCHSVALENPLQHLLCEGHDVMLATIRRGKLGFRVNGGPLFRSYLTLLSHLRPFIESGAVVLVEAHWGSVRSPMVLPSTELQSLIRDLDIDTRDYFPGYPDNEETRQEAKASMIGVCLEYLRFVSQVRQKSANAVDLFIEEPLEQAILRFIQQRCAALAAPEVREYEIRLLHHLLHLQLPRLEELSDTDIKRIREEGAFAEWREALTLALDRFDRESPNNLSMQETSDRLRAHIVLALEPYIARVNREVKRSSFLGKVGQGLLDIAVGAGIDVLMGTMGVVSAAAIAKQGLMATYNAYKESRGGQATATPFESHYMLFRNASSAGGAN